MRDRSFRCLKLSDSFKLLSLAFAERKPELSRNCYLYSSGCPLVFLENFGKWPGSSDVFWLNQVRMSAENLDLEFLNIFSRLLGCSIIGPCRFINVFWNSDLFFLSDSLKDYLNFSLMLRFEIIVSILKDFVAPCTVREFWKVASLSWCIWVKSGLHVSRILVKNFRGDRRERILTDSRIVKVLFEVSGKNRNFENSVLWLFQS